MGLPAGPVLAIHAVAQIEPDPAQCGHFQPNPEPDRFPQITKVQFAGRVPGIPGLEEEQPVERIRYRKLELARQNEHGLAAGVTIQNTAGYGITGYVRPGHDVVVGVAAEVTHPGPAEPEGLVVGDLAAPQESGLAPQHEHEGPAHPGVALVLERLLVEGLDAP